MAGEPEPKSPPVRDTGESEHDSAKQMDDSQPSPSYTDNFTFGDTTEIEADAGYDLENSLAEPSPTGGDSDAPHEFSVVVRGQRRSSVIELVHRENEDNADYGADIAPDSDTDDDASRAHSASSITAPIPVDNTDTHTEDTEAFLQELDKEVADRTHSETASPLLHTRLSLTGKRQLSQTETITASKRSSIIANDDMQLMIVDNTSANTGSVVASRRASMVTASGHRSSVASPNHNGWSSITTPSSSSAKGKHHLTITPINTHTPLAPIILSPAQLKRGLAVEFASLNRTLENAELSLLESSHQVFIAKSLMAHSRRLKSPHSQPQSSVKNQNSIDNVSGVVVDPLLSNLSFSNSLVPLTREALLSDRPGTSAQATRFPIVKHSSPNHGASTSVVGMSESDDESNAIIAPLYQGCFPSWLASRTDFQSFIVQRQLLCLHIAEKPRETRSGKDIAKLVDFFRQFGFFMRFSSHVLSELARCCWLERRKRGDRVDSKSETGSVMRFVYEGSVAYESSIARMFKKKKATFLRMKAEKEKTKMSVKLAQQSRRRANVPNTLNVNHGLQAYPQSQQRSRGITTPSSSQQQQQQQQQWTLSATQPLTTQSQGLRPTSSMHGELAVTPKFRDRSQSALQSKPATPASPLVRTSSLAVPGGSPSQSSSRLGTASSQSAHTSAIIENAMSYNPSDHLLTPPSINMSLHNALDELLISKDLVSGQVFGQSLIFEHSFSSYSFSQIWAMKQSQRLHALLGFGSEKKGWGAVKLLIRSMMEHKSNLHIHSVECSSDDVIFLCWAHSDLEVIASEAKQFDTNQITNVLKNLPFFQSWPYSVIQDTAARAEARVYHKGDYIAHEGEAANSIYFILSGKVAVLKHCLQSRSQRWPDSTHSWCKTETQAIKSFVIGSMSEGDVIGLEAIFNVQCRDLSAKVVSDRCQVYIVKKVAFASWASMKRVVREVKEKVRDWRRRAVSEIELQATKLQKSKQAYYHENGQWDGKFSQSQQMALTDGSNTSSSQEEAKEMVIDRIQIQQSSQSASLHSSNASSVATTTRRKTVHHLPSVDTDAGELKTNPLHSHSSSKSVRTSRRQQLLDEAADRSRRVELKNEEFWLDRIYTIEKMQEEKRKQRQQRNTLVKKTFNLVNSPGADDTSDLTPEWAPLPLLARTEARVKANYESDTRVKVSIARQPLAMKSHTTKIDREIEIHRPMVKLTNTVQIYFDPALPIA